MRVHVSGYNEQNGDGPDTIELRNVMCHRDAVLMIVLGVFGLFRGIFQDLRCVV
jgi:hypothetical protein